MDTQKILAEIYEKAKKVAINKGPYSEKEFQTIKIYADGTLGAIYSVGGCGYYEDEYEDIDFNDLEKTPEQLRAEWKQEVAERKRKSEEAQKVREEQEKLDEEKREREQLIKLQKKYGKL